MANLRARIRMRPQATPSLRQRCVRYQLFSCSVRQSVSFRTASSADVYLLCLVLPK